MSVFDAMNQRNAAMQTLNAETLATLRSYSAPGMDFVAEVVGAFLGSVDGYLGQLDEAVAKGDAEGVHRAAHPLKSSSKQVGADAFSEVCKEMEMAGRQGRVDEFVGLHKQLRAAWAEVSPLLEAEVAKGG
ncbi:MAG: Hpt domain-containing protein [Myxococcota bacterium]|nr:Hpt domain-containing protein [Myxococcota bacterium]